MTRVLSYGEVVRGSASRPSQFEALFFQTLNSFVEPLVRAGLTSPPFSPAGAILLETTGRKSGRKHQVPVLAARFPGLVLVATLRGSRSDWLRNAATAGGLRYQMGGRWHQARALVYAPGIRPPEGEKIPLLADFLAASLEPWTIFLGAGFAILVPQ